MNEEKAKKKDFRDAPVKENTRLNEPVENGFFLKINPTINRLYPEALARIFSGALKHQTKTAINGTNTH
ncbi:MAG TPA: hypothetical protein VFW07_13615 [Parafilimonas sp.]|nr:hypothetical protein [Parafilimonas sp.]